METKKIVDLNFVLVDIHGIPLVGENHAGNTIGHALVTQPKGDALKFWAWAITLAEKKPLELDESDYITFRNFVKDNEHLFVITKAQVLKKFKD